VRHARSYKSSWGRGNEFTDWNRAAEQIGNRVLEVVPRWLIFVEGVGHSPGAQGDLGVDGGYW
jgi:endoglucanase